MPNNNDIEYSIREVLESNPIWDKPTSVGILRSNIKDC